MKQQQGELFSILNDLNYFIVGYYVIDSIVGEVPDSIEFLLKDSLNVVKDRLDDLKILYDRQDSCFEGVEFEYNGIYVKVTLCDLIGYKQTISNTYENLFMTKEKEIYDLSLFEDISEINYNYSNKQGLIGGLPKLKFIVSAPTFLNILQILYYVGRYNVTLNNYSFKIISEATSKIYEDTGEEFLENINQLKLLFTYCLRYQKPFNLYLLLSQSDLLKFISPFIYTLSITIKNSQNTYLSWVTSFNSQEDLLDKDVIRLHDLCLEVLKIAYIDLDNEKIRKDFLISFLHSLIVSKDTIDFLLEEYNF